MKLNRAIVSFELNYATTKGKVYSEEEDRYLLCRPYHYGMQTEEVYDRIKKDITVFPVLQEQITARIAKEV